MPGVLALPAFWGAVGAGATAGGAIYGAHEAGEAADTQAQAAKYAADVQAKSAADTLAFQKQQAAQDLANANVTAQGNYNQYKAKEIAANAIRSRLGGPAVSIPAFTPYSAAPDTSSQPRSYATTASAAMGGPEQQVMMRAPTGETSSVPYSQVAHYQSRGAQIVG
jgi:hypothetical protein